MQSRNRIKVSLCLGFIALTGVLTQSAMAGGAIVISQIFGGGGQTAAGPNGDFIELFNRSCVAVNLDGYSVQVASGGSGTTWNVIQLPNFQLDPGKYYCIRLFTSGTGTPFTHDQLQVGLPGTISGDLMLTATGKAAIVVGNAPLPTGTCPAFANVVDFVKYEGASNLCTEGNTVGGSFAGGRSASRRPDVNGDGVGDGCQDTDVNSADFLIDADPAVPRNNATPANLCPGAPVFGGCSLETGACIVTANAAACAALGGNYLGDCTACIAPQACCLPTTPVTCVVESETECQIDGGIFNPGQFTCPPIPACPVLGRCCSPDGTCIQTFQVFCVSPNLYGGDFTTCAGTPCLGRCCDVNGDCTLTGEINCVAPSTFAGVGTTCDGTPCQGRCCAPNGDCAMTSEVNCTAPNVFAGLGSVCGDGSACVGACCSFNGGECTTQGPANCNAPDVFAGLGTSCALVQCSGRCCQSSGSCAITSPGQCTTGVFTIGQTCDPVQVFQFNDANMIIVDNPVQTPASNIQTIESPGPLIITDLDVDMNATHTYVGDVEITLEHLGVSVIIYDRPGVVNGVCCGCFGDNFNIILDDEGNGGAIEDICNATVPSALSPPNFTPANPLSAFDGLDAVGEWTITSRDYFTADTGTLLSWSLHVGFTGQACPVGGCTCFGDMNGDAVVNGKDVKAFAQCVAAGGAGCACGDMNHAGGATSADVPSFVTACLTGTCGAP